MDQAVAGNGDDRADRFRERSLARSKLKRDGLTAGTPAPDFRLPRLDGRGELTLSDLRGRKVLMVFSSPGCGPCNTSGRSCLWRQVYSWPPGVTKKFGRGETSAGLGSFIMTLKHGSKNGAA